MVKFTVGFDDKGSFDAINFHPIPVLIAPAGVKEFCFDSSKSFQSYLDEGWTEVKIATATERIEYVSGGIQATRKQYGLKHRVTSTIHACMGDTLPKIAIELSLSESEYKLWDKAQVSYMLCNCYNHSVHEYKPIFVSFFRLLLH